jgi:hydrogenase/urease accessory protein HupE
MDFLSVFIAVLGANIFTVAFVYCMVRIHKRELAAKTLPMPELLIALFVLVFFIVGFVVYYQTNPAA